MAADQLGASYSFGGFTYLPRQDGCSHGDIKQYEFYVSVDGANWGSPVASGTFNYGSSFIYGCPGGTIVPAIVVNFPAVTGSFVRLRALNEMAGNPWTSVSELNVITAAGTQVVPASMALSPSTLLGGNSSQATVTLSAAAPAGSAVVMLSSSNTVAVTVPASITVPAGQTSATFSVATTVGTSGTAGGGTASAKLIVQAQLSQAAWTLKFVDSQETVGENGAATNAFDGNTSTFWHTQWLTANPPPPHEIQINLGASYALNGFTYLPRDLMGLVRVPTFKVLPVQPAEPSEQIRPHP